MKAIQIYHLTKKYKDVTAVEDLNLFVDQGEIFSLLGINGAGKTTTLKMLTCLTSPTSGDALLMGKSITKEPGSVKAMIGVSPQETAIAAGLTVKENLDFMCEIYGFSAVKKREKTEEICRLLSLKSVWNRKAGKLSGGWQRRLSIAMALIGEPKILFLDEPTLGLDVIARSELWDLIGTLRGKVTIVLTTHYMEEAEKLSDRIAILKDGALLACDSKEGICASVGAPSLEEAFIRIVKGATV